MTWIPMFWCGAANVGRTTGHSASQPADVAPAVRWAKTVSKVNCELTSLASRRMQAWQAIPSDLARARTPADVFTAQMQFWQTAAGHHTAAARAIAETWTALMPVQGAAGATVERDHLVLPGEAATVAPTAQRQRGTTPGQDRRAA